jgi:hypothetical protein
MKVKTLMIAVLGAGLMVYLVVWKNRAIDELHAIQRGWNRSRRNYLDALQSAKTNDERKRLAAAQFPNPEGFSKRCLGLAEAQGDTALGLAALWWAACNSPKTESGKKALVILESGRLDRADLNEMMFATERATPLDGPSPIALVRLVLERVKLHLDHPQAARLLTWVCANDFFERARQESPTFAEAADLIASHFAGSPGIQHFCECLAPIDRISPSWAGKYEQHLRAILEKNSDRFVRCSAQFALASVVRSTGEAREDEAAVLYQQFIDQFKEHTNPGTSHFEEMYVGRATKDLAKINAFAMEQGAPEIEP